MNFHFHFFRYYCFKENYMFYLVNIAFVPVTAGEGNDLQVVVYHEGVPTIENGLNIIPDAFNTMRFAIRFVLPRDNLLFVCKLKCMF